MRPNWSEIIEWLDSIGRWRRCCPPRCEHPGNRFRFFSCSIVDLEWPYRVRACVRDLQRTNFWEQSFAVVQTPCSLPGPLGSLWNVREWTLHASFGNRRKFVWCAFVNNNNSRPSSSGRQPRTTQFWVQVLHNNSIASGWRIEMIIEC